MFFLSLCRMPKATSKSKSANKNSQGQERRSLRQAAKKKNAPHPEEVEVETSNESDSEPLSLREEVDDIRSSLATMTSKVSKVDEVSKKLDLLLAAMNSDSNNSRMNSNPNLIGQDSQDLVPGGNHEPQPSTSSHAATYSQSSTAAASAQHSSMVDQSVRQHIDQIMASQASHDQGEDFLSVSLPLDVAIDDKVKSAIWALEYTDLTKLKLNDPSVSSSSSFDIDISSPLGTERLHINTGRKAKPFEHLPQWFEAFHIFMTIHCQKYPEDSLTMLNYQYTIKALASEGGDWQRYDTQFRRLFKGRRVPWNRPHVELFVRCYRRPKDSSSQKFQSSPLVPRSHPYQPKPHNRSFRQEPASSQSKSKHPKGQCFDYHDYGRCRRERCKYPHRCYNQGCGAEHPVFLCGQRETLPLGHVRSQANSSPAPSPASAAKPSVPSNANKAARP